MNGSLLIILDGSPSTWYWEFSFIHKCTQFPPLSQLDHKPPQYLSHLKKDDIAINRYQISVDLISTD